ncbi:MAG TPA: L,D-transpeptidase family protein [Chitinophagaceae bacterium]
MRYFLLSVFISLIIAACNSENNNHESETSPKPSKTISSRDFSINPSNSYSDLFLDSNAMENYISQKKIPDSLANHMRSFYNSRNYQYAWFNSNGLTEEARGFWNLHDYVTTYNKDSLLKDKSLQRQMDKLAAEDSLIVTESDRKILNNELTLTLHFIKYVSNYYETGAVKRKEMERFIPQKKEDPQRLADSIVNKKHKDEKYFEDVNSAYKALKLQLAKYDAIAKAGGWPKIPHLAKKLKKGINNRAISIIKNRLKATGDFTGNDSTHVFNDTLVMAVKNFQRRHGYHETGIIDDSLVKEMNVPVVKRMEQILMNMDRMRWMITPSENNLIVVNIPEFVLHLYAGNEKVFDMDVIVGKEGHNTMMFNGKLNQVIFSPYWNVPSSIVEKEILPEMEKDKNYLDKQDMEVIGKDEDGLPVIRQKPGDKNALGKIKFLFPNSFNIYFHDTPEKTLFGKARRAYSHGCIRLKEPEKMAMYVLRDQPEWTQEKIEEAMNSGSEKSVRVKDPIPVVITYYTAWVDNNGQLNFREDLYGHDSDLASRMFL